MFHSRSIRARLYQAACAALVAGSAATAHAQIATLDKGHNLLLNNGLQIWGLDQGASSFSYPNLANANMNGVLWSFGIDTDHSRLNSMSAGQKWGKWTSASSTPVTTLDATEQARIADMIALQVGDEQQGDLESANGPTEQWFSAAHAGNYFTNQLMYVNSFYIGNDVAYASFISDANPDAISFDSYPIDNPYGAIIYPHNWLSKANQFRRHALGSYIGATGNAPRPFGLYLQTYESTTEGTRHPGDVEMRWQQFTAWTMGFTFVDAFTVGGSSSLFDGSSQTSPNVPRYNYFKETSRQSRNLGPALTRLISYGDGPSIVIGKDSTGNSNPFPGGWLTFAATNAPPNQRYLSSLSAANIGTKNNGQPGDLYVGFFNPLHASFGDPAGTVYFMVTNGLGPQLNDQSATVADCMQRVTLNFDFTASSINSLQRMRRSDGQVETIPLTRLSSTQYQLMFDLEGGTGDLFKYNDGSPFVGGTTASTVNWLYWDSDGVAAGDNIATGANTGGSGTWDGASSKWHTGAANVPWGAGKNAVFWGAAGTITLGSAQSVSSLNFKSDGYAINGSTLTLSGPFMNVDFGVNASIGSALAGASGLIKNGTGTLNLSGSNSYTGGTTINGGVLGIASSAALGPNPASPTVNITINNGAFLRFNQSNITLAAQRDIALGSGGGGIDTNSNNATVAGVISGPTLTKIGAGTLTLLGANTHSSTSITGGTLLITSDGNLGTAPGTLATNITLDGGTLKFGSNLDIAATRGINMGSAGGTIDTNGFSTVNGYSTTNGFRGGDLTKTGAGTFYASATTGGQNNLWTGKLILKQGIWKIISSDGLPINPNLDGNFYPEQVTFDGGTLQINNSIHISSAKRGMMIQAGGGAIDVQNFIFTWSGTISGTSTSSVWTKLGNGTFRINTSTQANGTYNGVLDVDAGTVVLSGAAPLGASAQIDLADVAGVTLNLLNNETVGALSGGGANGGNVSLTSATLTAGNSANQTFAGVISGSGGITKAGSGTMSLTGNNTYSGNTTISAGALAANSATAIGATANTLILNGGTLQSTSAFSMSRALTINAGNSGMNASGNTLTLNGTGATTLNGNLTIAGGMVAFGRTAGSAVSVAPGATVTVNSGATLNVQSTNVLSDGVDHANVVNNGTLELGAAVTNLAAIDGSGVTTADGNLSLNRIRQNTLYLNARVTIRPGGGAVANRIDTLSSTNIFSATTLNLNDGKLITHNAVGSWNGSHYTDLTGSIQFGRNGGAWNGGGIETGMTAAQGPTALTTIAIAAASNIGRVGTTFGGVTLASGDNMLMYTYAGDADLNGDIDGDDFFAIDSGYNASANGYWRGDFNYDGRVDADDYFIINRNYSRNPPPLSSGAVAGGAGSAGVTVVPEPAHLAPLATAVLALAQHRRRRRPN